MCFQDCTLTLLQSWICTHVGTRLRYFGYLAETLSCAILKYRYLLLEPWLYSWYQHTKEIIVVLVLILLVYSYHRSGDSYILFSTHQVIPPFHLHSMISWPSCTKLFFFVDIESINVFNLFYFHCFWCKYLQGLFEFIHFFITHYLLQVNHLHWHLSNLLFYC